MSTGLATDTALEYWVKSISWEAEDILSFDLRPTGAQAVQGVAAGAHIDWALGNGATRSYSLLNAPTQTDRVWIAVQKDALSKGGSSWIHSHVRVGDKVRIAALRNHFALSPSDSPVVLIAGGIGITPMVAMVAELIQRQTPWVLHYTARNPQRAAFVDHLQGLLRDAPAGTPGQMHVNFDQVPGGAMLDLAAIVAQSPADAHFYACGPAPMLVAFQQACAHLPPAQVHLEHFSAAPLPPPSGSYQVHLAKSGQSFTVVDGASILDTLLDNGVSISYSCMQGVCGACETRVLSGEVDHKDLILSPAEQASNRTMMVCCSGAKGAALTLDL